MSAGESAEMDANQRKELRNLIQSIKQKNSNAQVSERASERASVVRLRLRASSASTHRRRLRRCGLRAPTVARLDAAQNLVVGRRCVSALRRTPRTLAGRALPA